MIIVNFSHTSYLKALGEDNFITTTAVTFYHKELQYMCVIDVIANGRCRCTLESSLNLSVGVMGPIVYN